MQCAQPSLSPGREKGLWHTSNAMRWLPPRGSCALVWVQAQFFRYHGPGSLWTSAGSFLREWLTLNEEKSQCWHSGPQQRPRSSSRSLRSSGLSTALRDGPSRTRAEPLPAEPPTAATAMGQPRSFPLQSGTPWQLGLQCLTTAQGAPMCSFYPRKSRINSIYDSSFVFTVRCYFYNTFLEVTGGW